MRFEVRFVVNTTLVEVGAMSSSIKFVFMPPQDELTRWFAHSPSDSMPEYEVVSPKDDAEAAREIVDADGAFGWVSPEMLPLR